VEGRVPSESAVPNPRDGTPALPNLLGLPAYSKHIFHDDQIRREAVLTRYTALPDYCGEATGA